MRVLADDERPIWSQMSFAAAEDNFHAAARAGIDARLYWPGVGEAPAGELVLRKLLPGDTPDVPAPTTLGHRCPPGAPLSRDELHAVAKWIDTGANP